MKHNVNIIDVRTFYHEKGNGRHNQYSGWYKVVTHKSTPLYVRHTCECVLVSAAPVHTANMDSVHRL